MILEPLPHAVLERKLRERAQADEVGARLGGGCWTCVFHIWCARQNQGRTLPGWCLDWQPKGRS